MDRASESQKNEKMKLSARIRVFNMAMAPGNVAPVQRFRDPAAKFKREQY